MKKRALPILLVMVLLLAALSVTAFASTNVEPNDVSQYARDNMMGKFDGVDSVSAYCPVCNQTKTWYALDKGMTGETDIAYATCHWFLKNDIAHSGGNFKTPSGATICLYLNGKAMTGTSVALTNYGGTLNLIGNAKQEGDADSVTGSVSGSNYGNYPAIGATVDMMGGTLNLYGGTYTKNNDKAGPVIGTRSAAGTVNVYNGATITGGVNTNYGGNVGLYVTGSALNIYGGTVTGGQASGGGNIGITAADCTLNLSGGEVIGGQATAGNGGNVSVGANSLVNINGGTVTGGTATNWGGNFYGESGARFVMTTGTVQTGNGKYGGNFGINNAFFTISGGTIKNGTATNGGNLYLSQHVNGTNGGATITGGTISGGNASSQGGNIFTEKNVQLTLGSGVSLDGGISKYQGGSVYCSSGAALNINGATIDGGTSSSSYGGSVAMEGGTLTMTTGTIKNGSAAAGGCVYLFSNASFNLESGTVSGGKATGGNGGNVYATGTGTISVTGGDITGGQASNWGGNCYGEGGATYNISAGTIQTGQGGNGGNIGINNAYLVLSGGTIKNGTASYGGNIYFSEHVGGSIGGATITGGTLEGGSAPNGGSVYMKSGSVISATNLAVNGGTAVDAGGAFYVAGKLTLTDCAVSGGKVTASGAYKWGGNFYVEGGAKGQLTIAGTTAVSGGEACNGGNICVHDNATLKIESGTISGGTSVNYGGNIYMFKGTMNQTGGTVKNGTSSTERGGNLYITGTATVTVDGASYQGGTAASYGGSIYTVGALTLTDTTVTGGNTTNASGIGGNIAVLGGTASVTGGSVTNGTATSGGNLYTKSATSAVFNGVTISGGTAGTGGNGYFSCATILTDCVFTEKDEATGTGTQFYNDATVTLDSCTLADGTIFADGGVTAKDSAVNTVTIRKGTITLQGGTNIASLTMSTVDSIYAELVVDTTFSGTVNVTGLANGTATYGAQLAETYTSNGDFSGKVILTAVDAKPWAFHDSGRLVVGKARTVKKVDDKNVITWHKDNAAAAANYGDADMLWPSNDDLPLVAGDYVVNVSGWTMNVTGPAEANVIFYDSANADFNTYGTVTVDGPTVSNTFATEGPDGFTYYMIQNGNAYSFHRLSVKVNGVSIRPSTAGIYYTSQWACDDLLKAKIQSFGVAVSLANQPDAGFRRDADTLFTAFDKNDFVSGKTMTSVLINEILAQGKDNATRATKPVYATAYVVFDDGTDAGVVAVDGANQNYSLKGVMELIDNNPKFYLSNKSKIDPFYDTWKDVMGAWNLQNITGTPADPSADGELNVLMIGNSFCYYYVQELYDLLDQDGTKANIYNLYKSGCTLEEHYNWWNSNHNGYQFFWKTNENGYNLVKGDTTMADSLMAENWDVISIQESLFKNIQSANSDAYVEQAKVYMDTLIPMLKAAFPKATIYWHQQWCPEIGFTQGQNSIADAAAQANYAQKEASLAAFAKDTYGVEIVNTGDAWVNFRANEESVKLLPDGGLCARVGENNFAGINGGDGYHDGDIGGGQFLNACVWYEALTGKDCREKAFRGDKIADLQQYTLPADLVTALQEAAHSVSE